MKFSLQVIRTASDGAVLETQTISDEVIRRIAIEETVGDEFFTKASDINIETNSPLTVLSGSGINWLVLYIKDKFYQVYKHPLTYLEHDDKIDHYKYRCDPLQKIFYDHLESTAIEYEATHPSWWNYELPNSWITIHQIPTSIVASALDRVGFAIGSLLDVLLGQDNGYGYSISEINHPDIPLPNAEHMPIIWRGQSFDEIFDSDQTIINGTFKQSAAGDLFNMTWLDIFKFAIFGWNAFVKTEPIIEFSTIIGLYQLGVKVTIVPKINLTPSGQIQNFKWIERKKIIEKYKIDGVSLAGNNFTYEQGNQEGGNVFSRSIAITDYDEPIAFGNIEMYWAEGDYNPPDDDYILIYPWFASGHQHVQGFYANMITLGDGYQGKAKLNYSDGQTEKLLHALDQILIGAETIQVTTIRCGEDGQASIEGVVIG